jgi:hypothetical protein
MVSKHTNKDLVFAHTDIPPYSWYAEMDDFYCENGYLGWKSASDLLVVCGRLYKKAGLIE